MTMTTRIRLSIMVAAIVVAGVLPSSAAVGPEDVVCNKTLCPEKDKADPAKLAGCDECAQEADYSVVMVALGECDASCKAAAKDVVNPVEAGSCMEPCTAKAAVAAAAVATRSCYRKCAVDPAGVKPCQARCDAAAVTADKGIPVDKALDACFKKCAGDAGTDAARVFACDVACPFDAVATQIWSKKS